MKMKNTSSQPLVSIVIPVKNGADTLRACLNGIFSQTVASRLEVIVIDSGSKDSSLDILAEFPVKVVSIPPSTFNHGGTRNTGASLATGEFVVFTVQDAVASEPAWLEKLLTHFDDPAVSAVCGQQIVDHDPSKNPLQWFRPAGSPELKKIRTENFASLSAKEKHDLCHWDNVNAAYRKSALEEIPFRTVSFGEDALWAYDALNKGKTIVYDYSARVWHYHHQDYSFYFKRSYITFYQDHTYFGYIPTSQALPVAVAKTVYRLFRSDLHLKQKFAWTKYNLKLISAKFMARLVFRWLVITGGENGIDRGLQKYCRQVPQGRQNSLKPQTT
jgi:rhamnosyltransferase